TAFCRVRASDKALTSLGNNGHSCQDERTASTGWIGISGQLNRGFVASGNRSRLLARGRDMLEFFSPIQHNAHFVGRPILHIGLHKKESLTVWAHVVDSVAQPTHQKWRVVRDDSRGGRAEGGFGGYSHAHKIAGAHIEQLASILRPHWHGASVGRNLPFAARPRKGLHVNFITARLFRLIRNPAAVWVESGLHLVEFCLKKGLRFSLACERRDPDVPARG